MKILKEIRLFKFWIYKILSLKANTIVKLKATYLLELNYA